MLCATTLAWAWLLTPLPAAPASNSTIANGKPYDNSRSALGTKLVWVGQNKPATVFGMDGEDFLDSNPLDYLISDDETLSPELPAGNSLFVLKARATHRVSSFSFYNHGAAGTYRVSTLDGSRWKPVSPAKPFSSRGPYVADFPQPVETRQVKVEFETATPGQVSGFGIAGPINRKDNESVRLVHQPDIDTLNSVVVPGEVSSIVGVAPSAAAQSPGNPENMVDDLVETYYRFDTSRAVPAMLLDLGEARQIERVTALVETDQPLRMEVYTPETTEGLLPPSTTLLDRVLSRGPLLASTSPTPGLASWLTSLAAPVTTLLYQSQQTPGGRDPILTTNVAPGESRVILPLGRTYTARFVIILFRPTGAVPGNFLVREVNLLGRYIWRFYDDLGSTEEGNDVSMPPEIFEPPASP